MSQETVPRALSAKTENMRILILSTADNGPTVRHEGQGPNAAAMSRKQLGGRRPLLQVPDLDETIAATKCQPMPSATT
jgi:hypothetical protein